jgi:23S rRNA pseudouridine2457 synthase
VQVERIPSDEVLARLCEGVVIQGRPTLPCSARILTPQPSLLERTPPIRFRKNVPDCWISIELVEGKNRQVRKMTAAIGHPTLRLIRVRIGGFHLGTLPPGKWIELNTVDRKTVFAVNQR